MVAPSTCGSRQQTMLSVLYVSTHSLLTHQTLSQTISLTTMNRLTSIEWVKTTTYHITQLQREKLKGNFFCNSSVTWHINAHIITTVTRSKWIHYVLLNLPNQVRKINQFHAQLTSKWCSEQSKQLACPPSSLCIFFDQYSANETGLLSQ